MATENKKKVCDIVTERFIEQLRKGVIPWEKPWMSVSGLRVGAWNHGESKSKGGKPYSLLNQMMLPEPGEYITMKQIREEGGKLKAGSRGYQIVYWDSFKVTQKDENNVEKIQSIPFLKYYTVFSMNDVEGIEPRFKAEAPELQGADEIRQSKEAERVIKEYIERSGLHFERDKVSNEAYYHPVFDKVVVPLKKQFKKKAEYYSTVFHELVHSTGHKSRLNRFGTSADIAGKGKSYALEELVAEIGAAACLYQLGIETKASVKNSNAYLIGWLTALSNDHNMIVKASSRAEKAVRFLFGDENVFPNKDWKAIDHSKEVNFD